MKDVLQKILGLNELKYIITDINEIHNNINSSIEKNNIAYYTDEWNYINIYELEDLCKKYLIKDGGMIYMKIINYSNEPLTYQCYLKLNKQHKGAVSYGYSSLEAVINLMKTLKV